MSDADPAPIATASIEMTDAYARQEQIFPVLSAEMVARMEQFGKEETFEPGSYLFRRGDRSVDFFLVIEGGVEIDEYDEAGQPRIVHTHRARQFTGELDLFNDRKILVSGIARGKTRVIRIARADFRRMIASEPDIGEIIMRAFILRRVALLQHAQGGVTLVGPGHAADMVRLNAFLTRNGYPHRTIDTETDADAAGFLACFNLSAEELPVVIADGQPLRNPSNHELADILGLTIEIDPNQVFDVVVVGAGPSGLAAAVYAASEGLSTIILEGTAPGGQAGTSSKIENYLGFPTGISGPALAGRAQVQAQKFGARLAVSRNVTGIDCAVMPRTLTLEDGVAVKARSVVIASGARYRKLDLPDYDRFEGAGVHYAATAMEAQLCANADVVVVGGGNSAGQAAVFLSRHARHVHILVRGEGLRATMSSYLVDRIASSSRITLHPFSEVVALEGDHYLTALSWRNRQTGSVTHLAVGALFVMIGAVPNTYWLDGCLDLDPQGFVVTGTDGSPFQTSTAGIFAVGDVRSGSVKRVASGVGEGSVVVHTIHRYLEAQNAA